METVSLSMWIKNNIWCKTSAMSASTTCGIYMLMVVFERWVYRPVPGLSMLITTFSECNNVQCLRPDLHVYAIHKLKSLWGIEEGSMQQAKRRASFCDVTASRWWWCFPHCQIPAAPNNVTLVYWWWNEQSRIEVCNHRWMGRLNVRYMLCVLPRGRGRMIGSLQDININIQQPWFWTTFLSWPTDISKTFQYVNMAEIIYQAH